ncbi:MAG: replicative DNA helicase [Succiniclasticum sp.]|uniref:replicative DNA helicase n=1 Tax=Succiniclasticum sp. TaxID=2775030 RepID=UPI002A9141A8|nr:replicative DNA helicase [Succiniclasticum sp.]MDY6291897.1 replicative DNA helicase [Succiniclasticum sp.]
MQDRIPPQNIEAEQSVISAMLIDNKTIEKVSQLLKPMDFYRPSHQIIYQAVLHLHGKNEPVDLVTMTEELKNEDKLDAAGGISYLTLLANVVPTSANALYHARIVENNAIKRQLADSGAAIAALSYQDEDEVQSLLDKAEQTLLSLSQRKSRSAFVPIHDAVSTTMDHLGELISSHRTITGLPTGFADLDALTGGLHPSDFIILAARPSMGKTALALNIAQNVALRGAKEGEAPKRVAYFSLEMSGEQLAQRMICAEADADIRLLRSSETDNDTPLNENSLLDRLWEASARLAEADIQIDATPGLSVMDVRSRARQLKAAVGLDLIVIDYLQLMQGRRHGSDNRQHEVTEISRGLKALARELDVPVLALSQLSRSVELRQSKQPILSDLRESGSLEQDADIVMFLYREDYYKGADATPSHITDLIVSKHRNGPTGKVTLFFKDDCTKFISLSRKGAM